MHFALLWPCFHSKEAHSLEPRGFQLGLLCCWLAPPEEVLGLLLFFPRLLPKVRLLQLFHKEAEELLALRPVLLTLVGWQLKERESKVAAEVEGADAGHRWQLQPLHLAL